jgi:hypothetical protein
MSDTNAQAAAVAPRKLEGIGGWLLVPVANVVICAVVLGLFALMHAPDVLDPPAGTWGKNIFASGEFFLGTFLVFSLAAAAFGVYCLVATFRRKRRAPQLMIAFFILFIAWNIANAAGLWVFGSDEELDAGMTDAIRGVVQSLFASAIWIAYLRGSVRVKNTFVH